MENATNRVSLEVRRAANRRTARPGTSASPTNGGSGDIGSIHDKMVQQSNAARGGQGESASANVIIMIKQYLALPLALWKSDPLELWRSRKRDSSFLPMIDVVKIFLCIPATSVPSEQLFSAAGELVCEKRSRLTPDHVDMLLFLNKNA